MERQPSPNYDRRPADTPIDMLVLHYTGMAGAGEALDRLCDATARVSAHYLIDEHGRVVSLVDEEQRAWHAGVAWWRGQTDINGRSIGIELVNPGHQLGLTPFAEPQMLALIDLASDILARHPVPPVNVVGHSDIAPERKQDPGELFNWRRLAAAGIGSWPEARQGLKAPPGEALPMLAKIGYRGDPRRKTVAAFQRRYRPGLIDGVVDRQTAELIAAVLAISVESAL